VKSAAEARDAAAKCSACARHVSDRIRRQHRQALLSKKAQIARGAYFGIVLDRTTQTAVVMASQDGGVEIEKVAHETPDRIFKASVDPALGLSRIKRGSLRFSWDWRATRFARASAMTALYQAFATDASLLEINPLIVTAGGDPIALDAVEFRRQRVVQARGHQGTARPG
jgi:succinyl-CoA synthetase beta subunit